MNGPADRSIRLLLIMAGITLAYDVFRIVSGSRTQPVPVADLVVQVNFDPPERLRLLPGIGPAIASQVIEQRNHRPFRDSEDFVHRIRGIGPAFVSNFGPWLRFDLKTDTVAMHRVNENDEVRRP